VIVRTAKAALKGEQRWVLKALSHGFTQTSSTPMVRIPSDKKQAFYTPAFCI
jgi:hypothetical protein